MTTCQRPRCGHPRAAHEHYRRGLDCALCGCGGFRRWWPWWRALLPRPATTREDT